MTAEHSNKSQGSLFIGKEVAKKNSQIIMYFFLPYVEPSLQAHTLETHCKLKDTFFMWMEGRADVCGWTEQKWCVSSDTAAQTKQAGCDYNNEQRRESHSVTHCLLFRKVKSHLFLAYKHTHAQANVDVSTKHEITLTNTLFFTWTCWTWRREQ